MSRKRKPGEAVSGQEQPAPETQAGSETRTFRRALIERPPVSSSDDEIHEQNEAADAAGKPENEQP